MHLILELAQLVLIYMLLTKIHLLLRLVSGRYCTCAATFKGFQAFHFFNSMWQDQEQD